MCPSSLAQPDSHGWLYETSSIKWQFQSLFELHLIINFVHIHYFAVIYQTCRYKDFYLCSTVTYSYHSYPILLLQNGNEPHCFKVYVNIKFLLFLHPRSPPSASTQCQTSMQWNSEVKQTLYMLSDSHANLSHKVKHSCYVPNPLCYTYSVFQ